MDIWHFALSHILLEHAGDQAKSLDTLLNSAAASSIVFDGNTLVIDELDLISKLELTIGLAVSRRISIPLFAGLLQDCNMDWKDLYCQYVGKNVLNFFRQDHGYKEGSYRKLWGGREDNEHLVEIMAMLGSDAADYQHQLYTSLKDRYDSLA